MRVLVCGGRDYDNFSRVFEVLDDLHAKTPVTRLIEGGARGADLLAREWAVDRGVASDCYPADWNKDGRAAGPIRNRRMLVEGKPDLVVAFPGGAGTANMVKQARTAKVEVLEVTK